MARRDVLDSKRKGTTFPRHFHPRDIPSSFALMICIIFLMLLVLFLNCRNASRIIARNRSIMQIDWAFSALSLFNLPKDKNIFQKWIFHFICGKTLENLGDWSFSVKTKETETKTDPIKETQEHTRLVGNLASSLKSKRRCIHNYRAFVASVQLRTTLL